MSNFDIGQIWTAQDADGELDLEWLFQIVYSAERRGKKYWLCVKLNHRSKRPYIDDMQVLWFDDYGDRLGDDYGDGPSYFLSYCDQAGGWITSAANVREVLEKSEAELHPEREAARIKRRIAKARRAFDFHPRERAPA